LSQALACGSRIGRSRYQTPISIFIMRSCAHALMGMGARDHLRHGVRAD